MVLTTPVWCEPMNSGFLNLSLYSAKSDAHTPNYGVPQGSIFRSENFYYVRSIIHYKNFVITDNGIIPMTYKLYYILDPSIPGEAVVVIS